jgi:dipeptidyl aminopeptidase/acylaminoacyl peptidase
MQTKISLSEKFEYNGWPSMPRPDAKPPEGWSYPLLSNQERVFNPSVSPDGRWVTFIWHRDAACEVYVISSEGGFPRRISYGRKAFQYWWEEIPQWSPDGRSLAFCIDHHAYTADLEGGLPRKVSGFTESASAPRWMQDSEHLVITVERDGLDQLLLTDREGTWPRLLAANKGDNGDARPSPDGKFIIYTHHPLADLNREDICIADLQNGGGGIISGMPGRRCWSPRISPDGKRIIYLSNRTKFHELWMFQLDTASDEQLTHAGADLADPAWSPDGRWIAATINNGGMNDLVLVDPASGAVKELRKTRGSHSLPGWGTHCRSLIFSFNSPTNPPELYRAEIDPGSPGYIKEDRIHALTTVSSPAFKALTLVSPEVVTYKSTDGLDIPALMYKPEKQNRAAVVNPHGGPRGQSGFEWDVFTQYLLAKGYTYLEPNYRGSTGYGYEFEMLNQENWGGGDVQDILTAADYLAGLGWVDRKRIGVMGGSYGGYLAFSVLANDPGRNFACGVSDYGDADLLNSWALTEKSTRLYTEMQLGHPARKRTGYEKGSTIRLSKEVQSPLLISHGLEDVVVPPEASEEMAYALRKAEKTFEYKTYSGESHGYLLSTTLADYFPRVEQFLDWYLLPDFREERD